MRAPRLLDSSQALQRRRFVGDATTEMGPASEQYLRGLLVGWAKISFKLDSMPLLACIVGRLSRKQFDMKKKGDCDDIVAPERRFLGCSWGGPGRTRANPEGQHVGGMISRAEPDRAAWVFLGGTTFFAKYIDVLMGLLCY